MEWRDVLDKIAEGLEKARLRRDKGNRCALATGNDEGVAGVELLDGSHFDRLDFNRLVGERLGRLADKVDVLDEAALEGEDADDDDVGLHCGSWFFSKQKSRVTVTR